MKAGGRVDKLVICQDIAPTLIELAGGKPGPQIQGKSLLPLFSKKPVKWRKAVLAEYWAEQAYPKLVHYNKPAKGGHFPAWEQPKLFTQELRAGFRSLR